MTRNAASAAELFGEGMIRSFEDLEQARGALPPPKSAQSLVEDVGILGIGHDDVVVDVGAWGGLWSERLSAQYGCRCFALDLSTAGLSEASGRGVPGVNADAAVLPLRTSSVDVVWCRDTMSMVDAPHAVLGEFVRVAKPGGAVMLYTAYTTERLEPAERAWFLEALEAPEWWEGGRTVIDKAVRDAGLEVVACEVTSPEYSEALLGERVGEVADQLARIAQLRRHRQALEEVLGPRWYQRWLAWSHWQVYLFLGKLETAAWLLRAPS
jgi:SAM-dependent methyltransferase